MRSWVLLLAGIWVGCSGDDKTTPTGDDDDDDTDGNPTTETAHTGDGGPAGAGMQPVAVGFALSAAVDGDGALANFNYGVPDEEYPPQVVMIFADVAYFSATTSQEQEGHFCVVTGFFSLSTDITIPALEKPDQLDTRSWPAYYGTGTGIDNAVLYWSYDLVLAGLLESETYPCAGVVDADTWGEDAAGLIMPWVGAHFGWGFGQLTPYLREAYLDEGETTSDYLAETEQSMMAAYVAINDANGGFFAYDWTASIAYEMDPTTNTVTTDAMGAPSVLVPVDFLPVGADLPEVFVQSNPFWYQDFDPFIDFSNLTDGAPAPPE